MATYISKFDKYFRIHTSSAIPEQEFRFNYPITVWDKDENEWNLFLVQQYQNGNEIKRHYGLSNGRYNWVTWDENDIFLEEDFFFKRTKIGKLLHG